MQAYSTFIPLYFLPLVFIGAFFLLNLTLVVINSKFTETHNEQQSLDNQVIEKIKDVYGEESERIYEFSIKEFVTGRVYARKMIEFLRHRQKQKQ